MSTLCLTLIPTHIYRFRARWRSAPIPSAFSRRLTAHRRRFKASSPAELGRLVRVGVGVKRIADVVVTQAVCVDASATHLHPPRLAAAVVLARWQLGPQAQHWPGLSRRSRQPDCRRAIVMPCSLVATNHIGMDGA